MSGTGNNRDDPRLHDVDQAGSVVSGPSGRQLTNAQKLGIGLLILVVFLAFIWVGQINRTRQAAKPAEVPLTSGGTFRPAPIVLPPAPAPALPLPAEAPRSIATNHGHEMTAEESPIFAFSGTTLEPASPSAGLRAPRAAPAPLPAQAPPDNAISGKLKPTLLQGAKATMLPHPDMLLTEGTIIPCTLQTAIDSELAGFVKCVLPDNVRSTTGNVVLLDRGTIVVGEIQSGLVNGQDRVFVLWDRAETPDHAVIELASPGADELGRAGLSGAVDNHFWKRFGGAIMLSLIQGSLQAGTALAGNSGSGGSGTYFNSFQSNSSDVTNTALQATINIPPSLVKNQGDNVSIFVARDLDFSDIYNLRLTASAASH